MADSGPWNSSVPSDGERKTLLGSDRGPLPAAETSRWRRWWPLVLVTSASLVLVAVLLAQGRFSPPSPSDTLNRIDAAIAAGRASEADTLLRDLRGRTTDETFRTWPAEDRGRYHTAAAAVLRASSDRDATLAVAEARRIISHLEEARGCGWIFSPADLENLALAHLCVGEIAAARTLTEDLEHRSEGAAPDLTVAARVLDLRRALARHAVDAGSMAPPRRLDLLRDLRDDPSATSADLCLVAAEMAEIRLRNGSPDKAALSLYRDIRRLEARGGSPPPRLLVLLARAQRDQYRHETAIDLLRSALRLTDAADPLRGEALVLLGDAEAHRGRFEQAMEAFDDATRDYPASPSMLAAIAGRGRMADALGDPERAVRDFEEVIRRLQRGDRHPDVSITLMEEILLDRFESALTQSETDHALALARLAGDLRPAEERSVRVNMARAVGAGQVAAEQEAQLGSSGEEDPTLDREEASRTIRGLHAEAGDAYLAAARRLGEAAGDERHWADAMLQAGIHLDAAGRQQDATGVFRDYITARDHRDPRRPEAIFRLAQALEAMLSWDEAIDWYDRLVQEHSRSPQATAAYVPSARSLLALGRDDEARCRLEAVVDGETALRPGAEDYRASLIALGRLDLAEGKPADAIRHLREAADRWPDHPVMPQVLFDVATAQRALARAIERRLADVPISADERVELEADRLTTLWEAALSFEQVTEALQSVGPVVAERERLQRSAAVAGSDCLLETGRLKEAIRGYEFVARTWPGHPAAIHALVQVTTAWQRLGESDRASAAHQRALTRLEAMPDELLEREDAFMGREMWERWMASMPMTSDLYAEVNASP